MLFNNPETERIFVFGSNLAGRHGAGAALHAKKYYNAKPFVGQGRTGHSYALPTKDRELRTLSLKGIQLSVTDFLAHVLNNPNQGFNVTQVGCGLAGYDPQEIAPMFRLNHHVFPNIWLDAAWKKWVHPEAKFWKGPI